jgi:hypothetical protein
LYKKNKNSFFGVIIEIADCYNLKSSETTVSNKTTSISQSTDTTISNCWTGNYGWAGVCDRGLNFEKLENEMI